jgi:hypothetical protein
LPEISHHDWTRAAVLGLWTRLTLLAVVARYVSAQPLLLGLEFFQQQVFAASPFTRNRR